MAVDMRMTKEEQERAMEMFRDYLPTPGCGANLFDDWNELAPDFLDQCTVPAKPGKKGGRRSAEKQRRSRPVHAGPCS